MANIYRETFIRVDGSNEVKIVILYFVNGSKQRKKLIRSEYVEDIIDVMIEFFESHDSVPHIMMAARDSNDMIIQFPYTAEHFRITDVNSEEEIELLEWINQ